MLIFHFTRKLRNSVSIFFTNGPLRFCCGIIKSVQALKQKGGSFTENTIQDVERIKRKFQSCQKLFAAFGDETRQCIISVLLCGACGGSRVLDIAKGTNLSRPAVSHHMQVLKNAGIVKTRKEGTCIYYYLDPEENEITKIIDLFSDIQQFMRHVPDRGGED